MHFAAGHNSGDLRVSAQLRCNGDGIGDDGDKNKIYDRIGLEMETTNILGNEIVTTTIPVRPGRNLAIILEIAAMNNRQRRMGYNTAEEFNKRIMEQMYAPKEED